MKKILVFWSWNGKLEKERLIEEMDGMKQVGIGGFFIHARAGLEVPYFSEKWFEFVRFCATYAYSIGLETYLYDENGWPSGTSDGLVPQLSENYRQSWIEKVYTEKENEASNAVAEYDADGRRVFLVRKYNPEYADLMSEEAVKTFIRTTYEVYKTKVGDLFGKEILGIFTDEPQLSNFGYPFTDGLFELFEKRYGYSLKENIADVIEGQEGNKTRLDYRALVADLYENAYCGQIGTWCRENGLIFTGHLAAEDGLYTQIQTQGDVMPCYRHFTVPGIDSLGRRHPSVVLLKQISSAAAQSGQKEILCEIFGASGHSSTPKDWLDILFYEAMHGINVACLHLSAYTALGRRKRDFPPTFSYHMNYYNETERFFRSAKKLCDFASVGKESASVLIINPIESFFYRYRNAGIDEALSAITVAYRTLQENLLSLGFNYHLGNEKLLAETARAENGKLLLGECVYNRVIVPRTLILRETTVNLLLQFVESGGELYFAESLPKNERGEDSVALRALFERGKIFPLAMRRETLSKQLDYYGWTREIAFCEENSKTLARELEMTERIDGDRRIVFLRNFCYHDRILNFSLDGKNYFFDLFGGENAILCLNGSEKTAFYPLTGKETELKKEYLPYNVLREKIGFSTKRLDKNVFVADTCDAFLNGDRQIERNVVRLNETLNGKIENGDEVRAEYAFDIRGYKGELQAVVEKNVCLVDIRLNGKKISMSGQWFYDKDFLVYDLSEAYSEGKNFLSLFYRAKEKRGACSEQSFENVKNKYCEDFSLENVILLGDFLIDGEVYEYERLGREYFSLSDECISDGKESYDVFKFPYYRGRISYKGEFSFETDFSRAFIKIPGQYHVLDVNLNGKKFLFYGGAAEISEMLKKGKNTLEILLYTSDRNLMGPHRYFDMDSEMISPDTYEGKKGWFDGFNLRVPLCKIPSDTFSEKRFSAKEFVENRITILFN